MLCEVCEQEEAAFTIIPTGEGLPRSLGVACLARWVLDNIKEVLAPEEIAQRLGPMFVTPAREDLAEAHAAEIAKKPRKSKAKATPPEGEAEGPAAPSAAASDE